MSERYVLNIDQDTPFGSTGSTGEAGATGATATGEAGATGATGDPTSTIGLHNVTPIDGQIVILEAFAAFAFAFDIDNAHAFTQKGKVDYTVSVNGTGVIGIVDVKADETSQSVERTATSVNSVALGDSVSVSFTGEVDAPTDFALTLKVTKV